MPSHRGYAYYGVEDKGWTTCWTVTVAVFVVALGGTAIGFGAWNGFQYQSGLVNEDDFAFPLSVWSIVFGVVLLVGAGVYAIDVYSRRGDQYIRPPSVWSWLWTLCFVFIALPWNIIGHIFLLRTWTSTGDSSTALYIVSIIALVVSWLIVLNALWFLLAVLYEHNKQIGVSRRYLTDLTLALEQPSVTVNNLPRLNPTYRTLPLIMNSMMDGKRIA